MIVEIQQREQQSRDFPGRERIALMIGWEIFCEK